MANKHFTTNRAVREQRLAKQNEALRIRRERKQAQQERSNLLALQRKFNVRGGRVAS